MQLIRCNQVVPDSKVEGFSFIYRNSRHMNTLLVTHNPRYQNLKQLYVDAFKNLYCKRPFTARIAVSNPNSKEEKRTIEDMLTYEQAFQLAIEFGSGIIASKMVVEDKGGMKLIGIYCKNRVQFYLTDITSILYGITTVPLYDTLGTDNLSYCLQHSGIETCICSSENAQKLLKLTEWGNLSKLIILDPLNEILHKSLLERFTVYDFQDVLQTGKNHRLDYELIECKPNTCFTFSYTSGTTGKPKGAMFTHANFLSAIASFSDLMSQYEQQRKQKTEQQEVHLSMLPLPHAYERLVVVYYATTGRNVMKILEDIAVVRPTFLMSVPRIYNRILEGMMAKFGGQNGLITLINEKSPVLEAIRKSFGGRLGYCLSGSAPIAAKNKQLLSDILGCPFLQGYGQTENTAGGFITDFKDTQHGKLGAIMANLEFKLCDIPEMKYLSTDVDADNNPNPRGQIWLRGPGVIPGYYKSPELTAEAITPDGWLRTGDVGSLQGPYFKMRLIDRIKHIFKLSQGQYVASEKVESHYLKSEYINQCFLHGDSLQNYAVCIVSAREGSIKQLAKQLGLELSFEQLCQKPEIRQHVRLNLQALGKKGGLKGFEQAKNIRLVPQTFVSLGLVSSTMKLQRFMARKHFDTHIKEMYIEGPFATE